MTAPQPEVDPAEIETAMLAARAMPEYRAGTAFDVPGDAVERYTRNVIGVVLAAVLPAHDAALTARVEARVREQVAGTRKEIERQRMQFAAETRITSAAFNATQHRGMNAPRGLVGEALSGWTDAMRTIERVMRLACNEGRDFIETDVSRAIQHEADLNYVSVDAAVAARIARGSAS